MLQCFKMFVLNRNILDLKMNIGKYFRRWYSLARLPPALEVSANLRQEGHFISYGGQIKET